MTSARNTPTLSSIFTRICLALLVASSLTVVTAAPSFVRRDIPRHRGCGTHISAERRVSSEARFRTHRTAASRENATATLDVYFHVVFANQTAEGGYVPDEAIERQVEVLNRDYNTTGVSFKLVNVTRIQSEEWFLKVAPDAEEESAMKETFRYGNSSALNVWTVGFMEGDGKGLLGYATFPSDYESAPKKDGVVLLHSTMPDVGQAPYNKGRTLTHEAGHWAGLYHTFEGGCQGNGDFVDDTPPEKDAAYGCPSKKSTCPGGKQDPITNFMNYSDDLCMERFTDGQATRIRAQMRAFRGVDV